MQKNAYMFVLPDEVGGTHPALVEAMGFGNCVLVNDTASNLEVVGNAGFNYKGAEGAQDLCRKLQMLLDVPELVAEFRTKAEHRARTNYRWEAVVHDHLALYRQDFGVHGPQLCQRLKWLIQMGFSLSNSWN